MGLGLNWRRRSDPPVSRLENGSGAVGPRFHCLAASGDGSQGRENIGIDIAPRRHPLDRLGKCQKAWKLGFVGDAKGGVEFPHPVINGSRARTSSIVISGIWLLVSIAIALRMHCVRILAPLILLRFLPPRFCGFLRGCRFVAPDFRLYSNTIIPKPPINDGDFSFLA